MSAPNISPDFAARRKVSRDATLWFYGPIARPTRTLGAWLLLLAEAIVYGAVGFLAAAALVMWFA